MKRIRRPIIIKLAVVVALVLAMAALLVAHEFRTSAWQARYFAQLAKSQTFPVKPGPNDSARYPNSGPYDLRLGYHDLPTFLDRLRSRGYVVAQQAVPSKEMVARMDSGMNPPYREKDQAGLELLDDDGRPIYRVRHPERVYDSFASVPPLLVNSLLAIENRTLLQTEYPKRNPAVEWSRLARAVWDRALHAVDPAHESPGGSTLATQIEKYRHSPEGRTESPSEKLRQMFSASARAYLNGEDTTAARHQLAVDYLNTVPLGARAGFGEIQGIGDALWVWYGRDFAQINALLAAQSAAPLADRALAYKEALSLLVSQRRPSYYLENLDELETLTNAYLRVLAASGVIPPALRDAAIAQSLKQQALNTRVPPPPLEHKGTNAVRVNLAGMLGISRMYALDRLDLTASSTLDAPLQRDELDTAYRYVHAHTHTLLPALVPMQVHRPASLGAC